MNSEIIKKICFCTFLLFLFMAPNVFSKGAEPEKGKLVLHFTFNDPSLNRRIMKSTEHSIAKRQGVGNSAALQISRNNAKMRKLGGIQLGKLGNTDKYIVSCKIRFKDIKNSNPEKLYSVIYAEFTENGKYLGLAKNFVKITKTWQDSSFVFSPPTSGCTTCLTFLLPRGLTGTVLIDELKVIKPSNAEKKLPKGTIFIENFKNGSVYMKNLEIIGDPDSKGQFCGVLRTHSSKKNTSFGGSFITVKPDQWYRMKVRQKNTVKSGEVMFGLIQSRSDKKSKSEASDWCWKSVPLNINEWNEYVMEFKTRPDTHGVRLYLKIRNDSDGASYWKSITLGEFKKVFDPIEFKPFSAVATFTDIPTKLAYRVVDGDGTIHAVANWKTTNHWKKLELDKEKPKLKYINVPKNSTIKTTLVRGKKTYYSDAHRVSGSGELEFDIKLNKLQEGVYLLRSELVVNAETPFVTTKEIWRINSRKGRIQKFVSVKTTSTGKNRERLLNGKKFFPIWASQSPTWGMLQHHRKFCKPDLDSYIKTLHEQFGINAFVSWCWRGKRWDGKGMQFINYASSLCREYLDFLQKHNLYGYVVLEFPGDKKKPINFNELRVFIRNIKDHPALFEYSIDEPEFRYSPEDMIKLHKIVKEEDPNHNLRINLCDPLKFHLYAPSSDIASYDLYPFPGLSLRENRARTKKLLAAFPPSVPFDSYLQTFNFYSLKMPTFEQVRAEFILDRINGSKSLIAYSWGEYRQTLLSDHELQSYFRAIVSMFRRLTPVLSEGTKSALSITDSMQCVESLCVEYKGEKIVLLVNVSADFPAKISFAADSKIAEDFFDSDWKYKAKNGLFRFNMKPNAVKVLRLK